MVREKGFEPLNLAAVVFETTVFAISPLPHIMRIEKPKIYPPIFLTVIRLPTTNLCIHRSTPSACEYFTMKQGAIP